MLLDVGATMLTPLRERSIRDKLTSSSVKTTRFDAAVTAVESFVQQKVCYMSF